MTEQLAEEPTPTSLHEVELNAPWELLENPTVPVGVTFDPPVSDTVAVQVVGPPSPTLEGEQSTNVVVPILTLKTVLLARFVCPSTLGLAWPLAKAKAATGETLSARTTASVRKGTEPRRTPGRGDFRKRLQFDRFWLLKKDYRASKRKNRKKGKRIQPQELTNESWPTTSKNQVCDRPRPPGGSSRPR